MLEVRLIGGFDIQCDGKVISIPSRAAQSLFAYLILTAGTSHRREKLAGMLWPDESEQIARAYLRNELWRVRKALPRTANVEYLIADNLTVGLNQSSAYWLDVAELKSVSDTGSAQELIQALSNYRGELLPGFYEEWIVLEREHLQVLFEKKMACLLELLEKEQRWGDILEWAEHWISLAQAPEEAYRALMLAYEALGDHSKVASTYDKCKQALRQLELEPSEETRALVFKRNLKINIPIPLTSFIGREKELKEVSGLFSKSRLVTLTGSGGIGKTRLAIQVVAEVLDKFPDGVWFLDLAPLSDPALVPNTLASLLGLRESGEMAVTELLINYFRSRTALVIFDNCEHLIDASAQLINSLLRSCEHIAILATSRETLRVSGELPYRVPSLEIRALDTQFNITEISNVEAIRLFVERAAITSPAFILSQQNAMIISQICQRLDGIPLALELAAARMSILTAEQVLIHLDNRFDLLTNGLRSALPRHQTLRATIEWSYELLSEKECILFRRLAVFVGGWTLEAAQIVCRGNGIESGEVLNLLSQLVNKSLVVVETSTSESRYRRLETIREFSREKLRETGEEEMVRQQHLQFFVQLAERAEPNLRALDIVLWLDRLKAELPNLRAALDWTLVAESNRKVEIGLQIVAALGGFWLMRGLSEGRAWLGALLQQSKGAKHTLGRAKALALAGDLAVEQAGDSTTAHSLYEEALSIQRELGDKPGAAASLLGLGATARAQGNFLRARSFCEQSLAIWQELGQKWGIAWAFHQLSFVAFAQGDLELACSFCNESLAIRQELGDKPGIAWVLDTLGEVARYQGDYDQAQAWYEQSLKLHRELGSILGIAALLSNMGYVALNQGNDQLVRALFKESLSLSHELGHMCTISLVLIGLAGLEEQPNVAARLLGAAEPFRRLFGAPADGADYERIRSAVRAQLDEAEFAASWAEGRAMPLEQVVDHMLREL